MIQLYLFLPLLVFFFAGILLLLVLHGKARSRVHRMFALLLLALGLWGLTIFGMRSSGSLSAAIAWERFALTAVLAVSLFFYHFTVLFKGNAACPELRFYRECRPGSSILDFPSDMISPRFLTRKGARGLVESGV